MGVGCHFLLQGIFLTQGPNSGLPHCGQIFYPLSRKGIPGSNIVKRIINESQYTYYSASETNNTDFPGGPVVKNPPASAGDMGPGPGLGRSNMLWGS